MTGEWISWRRAKRHALDKCSPLIAEARLLEHMRLGKIRVRAQKVEISKLTATDVFALDFVLQSKKGAGPLDMFLPWQDHGLHEIVWAYLDGGLVRHEAFGVTVNHADLVRYFPLDWRWKSNTEAFDALQPPPIRGAGAPQRFTWDEALAEMERLYEEGIARKQQSHFENHISEWFVNRARPNAPTPSTTQIKKYVRQFFIQKTGFSGRRSR